MCGGSGYIEGTWSGGSPICTECNGSGKSGSVTTETRWEWMKIDCLLAE